MILTELKPKKALNKAFLKLKPTRIEIEIFKSNLINLLDRTNDKESEEFHKNLISDFLKDTYYKQNHFINTKGRNDLVIHIGQNANSTVGVIIEAKKPTNKAEMISNNKLNVKAFQELVLYYLRERITHKNLDIKHLVVTNINEWYIFNEDLFERLFAQNKSFVKQFEHFEASKKTTDVFYKEIAEPFIAEITTEIEYTCFNIQDYQKPLRNEDKSDDNQLIALYKIFSPEHLLKLPFANDSNSLDKGFYNELLHIMGLTEVKEGGKKLIQRKKVGERLSGTILEETIIQLDSLDKLSRLEDLAQFGNTREERLFNVALELSITWINRILFLKLLEGQIVRYHKSDKRYSFLNLQLLKEFDDLNSLFFQVLAKKVEERNEDVKNLFSKVPYLNSTLFEPTELEHNTLFISNLKDNKTVSIFSQTVLKDLQGRKRSGNITTLQYLFEFLDAYDFGAEGSEEIQEENKTLINSAVLGLIFEKINGYKEGSFFTPGFITMYMSRETVRRAVIQKFNETKGWKCQSFEELKEDLMEEIKAGNRKELRKLANKIINSLRIVDPAVGSGHFLVSVLNEIIAIKSQLSVLIDADYEPLNKYSVEVENDELVITDENGELFEYNPNNKECQRVQVALFHEKQAIIENCLFGVDINSNSVKICRLRLWIELLKNAYYKNANELETLPNIDINIKCGNSLVSRYAIDSDLKQALKKRNLTIEDYRKAVQTYRNAENKEQKRAMERLIDDIKQDFRKEISRNNPKVKKLQKLEYEYSLMTGPKFFEEDEALYGNDENKRKADEKQQKLYEEIEALRIEIEEFEKNKIFKNALEWRFEFPEVLSEEGDFVGFDVVIGNPPYGVSIKDSYRNTVVGSLSTVPDFEIYYFFINFSKRILKSNGLKSYIIPNTILFNVFAKNYRENLFNDWKINEILDCTEINVFQGSATVRCIVTQFQNCKSNDLIYYKSTANVISFDELVKRDKLITSKEMLMANNQNWALVFRLDSKILNIVSKIRNGKKNLVDHFPDISQGLIAYDKYQGQDSETIKNRIYHSLIKQKGWKKWLWGEDITPYSVKWNGMEYVNYCDGIANPREAKFFSGGRILVREITNPKIYAGFTDDESYNDPAIINILNNSKSEISIKVLLSILNSRLATYYHFNSSPKATKGAFPKILVNDLKKFPLPIVSPKFQKELIDYVNKIIIYKEKNKEIKDLESQIDQLVYQLYDLTEEEIKIIENS